MSVAWTSFKIGLFTLLVLASAVAITLALGLQPGPRRTVRYHTYFDETVTGLDLGAPVKYRGITIGAVKAISVAPDGRMVDVAMDVGAADAWLLEQGDATDKRLRAQVSAPGITGVKLIDLEYVDPATHPEPRLTFPPADKYVPSAHVQSLASATDAVVATLRRVDEILQSLDAQQLPARTANALASVERAAADLRTAVRHVNEGRVAERTSEALARLDETIGSMQRILHRVDADGGLLTTAERATQSADTLGRRAAGATEGLDRTVRDLDDAARAVRALADAIERDPDMLLKGRQKGTR
jgi:paraquat-inducible protein B